MNKVICKNCGKKFIPYDKPFNVLCYKCKKKILKRLTKPMNFEKYFRVSNMQSVKFEEEYSIAPELEWINNARYSTDYWMYNNMASCLPTTYH